MYFETHVQTDWETCTCQLLCLQVKTGIRQMLDLVTDIAGNMQKCD